MMIHLDCIEEGKFVMPDEVASMDTDTPVAVCGNCLRLIIEDINKCLDRNKEIVNDYNRAVEVINLVRGGLKRGISKMKNEKKKISRKEILHNLEIIYNVTKAPEHLDTNPFRGRISVANLDEILDLLRKF